MTPPIVYAPGLVCDEAAFAGQVAALGGSVADHGELDSLAAMAERILDGAPERFVLVGHSMGGRVALEAVRRAPERIAGLGLFDTGFAARAADEAGEAEREHRLGLVDLARREGMRAMAAVWAEPMVHPSRRSDAALWNGVLDMIARKTPDVFLAQQTALLDRPDAGPVLEAIACPTLVLCGLQDSWSGPEQHREMARRIAGAQLAEIDLCGHMSTMERPEAVNGALRELLGAIRA